MSFLANYGTKLLFGGAIGLFSGMFLGEPLYKWYTSDQPNWKIINPAETKLDQVLFEIDGKYNISLNSDAKRAKDAIWFANEVRGCQDYLLKDTCSIGTYPPGLDYGLELLSATCEYFAVHRPSIKKLHHLDQMDFLRKVLAVAPTHAFFSTNKAPLTMREALIENVISDPYPYKTILEIARDHEREELREFISKTLNSESIVPFENEKDPSYQEVVRFVDSFK